MSVYRMLHMRCDHCKREFHTVAPTISELRLSARPAGWRCIRRRGRVVAKDLCPTCKEQVDASPI